MQDPVIIFGAGNTGNVVLDIFNNNNVLIYGFLDDNEKLHSQEIGGVVVLGDTDDNGFLKIIGNKTEAFVAIRNKEDRRRIVDLLREKRKTVPVNALHPRSTLSQEASLGHGNLIGPGVVLSAQASVGNHCIVMANSCIGPAATVADYVEIGQGVQIGANVVIEEGAFVGDGAVIVSGLKVGKNARIGAGSVVVEMLPEESIVFGNPAKKV